MTPESREYLFNAALVAIGPPLRPPRPTRDGIPTNREKFNAQVGEYNHFVQQVHGIVMPEYSHLEWSKWFHHKKD